MHEIKVFKGFVFYRADVENYQVSFFAFSKKGALRKAQNYINKLSGHGRGYLETVWYEPDLTSK